MDIQAIIEDGVVDEAEVAAISAEILADGVIDRDEANQLFEIDDAVSGNDNHDSWGQLVVDSITAHVLEDEETPGVLDAEEAAYVIEKIGADGQVDDTEKALIQNILNKATSVDPSFTTYATGLGITKAA